MSRRAPDRVSIEDPFKRELSITEWEAVQDLITRWHTEEWRPLRRMINGRLQALEMAAMSRGMAPSTSDKDRNICSGESTAFRRASMLVGELAHLVREQIGRRAQDEKAEETDAGTDD